MRKFKVKQGYMEPKFMTMTPAEKRRYEEDRANRKRLDAERVARRNRESYNDDLFTGWTYASTFEVMKASDPTWGTNDSTPTSDNCSSSSSSSDSYSSSDCSSSSDSSF